ncbi:MAG: L,D-transpeptidase family protein [Caldilineales bacterium]|nr:L,D-transpeptidase family protein [Caldilineales bacterium]MDW8318448.1 L,D-transpeptidase family protein [Anaerolineae bacterium]
MAVPFRAYAQPDPATGATRLWLEFPAPEPDDTLVCAEASLEVGGRPALPLGLVCAPTAVTWHAQHRLELGLHTLPEDGQLDVRWGDQTMPVRPAPPDPLLPILRHVTVEPQGTGSAILRLHAEDLPAGQRLRVDGGAGQVRWTMAGEGREVAAAWTFDYVKPGSYTVAVDLVDAEGFWLATLVERSIEVSAPTVYVEPAEAERAEVAVLVGEAPAEVPSPASVLPPWLPFRYLRPLWAGSRTYTRPGGDQVSRVLAAGTYLATDQEAVVNGALWYRSTHGDWIPASAVALLTPSELRGVELGQPSEPIPPTPSARRGVVTATLLNVRARPGVRADNPPVDRLRQGTEVQIFEQQTVEGAPWYRIGVDRWVHGGYVRLAPGEAPSPGQPAASGLPVGWVSASSLNVRQRPGTDATIPVVGQVRRNQRLDILETRTVDGQRWHRIGEAQWVLGQWVAVATYQPRPAAIAADELWVGVNLAQQTAVAYAGDRPVYAAMVATGAAGTPTVQGIFRTWRRLPSGKMSGPGYYIEGVTWTCYFYDGYALHTAYWHDSFGRPLSHGCVNLSPYDAWWIYQWSAPGGSRSPTVFVYPG